MVSLAWLRPQPTLRSISLEPIPPAAVALRSANGEPINVLGLVDFPLTLSEITRMVTALVVPSLGPDLMLLDNSVMSDFGVLLHWENQTIYFSPTGSKIPAVHRVNECVPSSTNTPSSANHNQNLSVAAVHRDAETFLCLCVTVNLKPEHEGLAVVYTDCLPPENCTVVVEARIVTEDDFSNDTKLEPSKNIVVARTLATWHASDGSVVIQIANASADGIRIQPSLCLGHLSTVSVVTPDQLRVNAVANTPVSDEDIRHARSGLESPLSKAFSTSRLTSEQKESVLDLCAKCRPVFSLSMSELRRCTIAEATFSVSPGAHPVDRPPYRPNPRTSAVIDKCVNEMLKWGIIEKQPSPWGSPCTIVAKSNGNPRFCVDYRHTLYRHIIHKSWPVLNLDSCLDAVGEALYNSVADILSAFWQLPVAAEHVDRTAFVTPSGKYCVKRIPFGVANSP